MSLVSRLLRIWSFILLLAIGTSAWSVSPVHVDSMDDAFLLLASHTEILEDKTGIYVVQDFDNETTAARFVSVTDRDSTLTFGYTRSVYWLRFQLINTGVTDIDRILEIRSARLAQIHIYAQIAGKQEHWQIGYADRVMTEEPARFPTARIKVPAGDQVWVYIRVKTPNSMNLPLRLWTPQAYMDQTHEDIAWQAGYFGMIFLIIVYNFLLMVILREKNYLLYLIFASSVALALLNITGIGTAYLWHTNRYWTTVGVHIPAALASVGMLLLTQRMLDTRDRVPRIHAVLQLSVIANCAMGFLIAVWFESAKFVFATVNIFTAAAILAAGVQAGYHRQRTAYFLVAAFALLFLTIILTQLRNLGFIDSSYFIQEWIQIAAIVDLVLLSIAMADQFYSNRKETNLAQRAAISAQNALIQNLKESERILESKVKERTELLQISNEKLEALTLTDSLTGVSNRRHFDKVFQEECRRSVRTNQPLVIGMVDVDWFKSYNDLYGHVGGDACLRRVATAMKGCLRRPGDLFARYGGEEFVFLAPTSDTKNGLKLASLLVELVSSLRIDHLGSPNGHVTISAGIVCAVPGSRFEDLIDMADAALYQAKRDGRNRVGLAELNSSTRSETVWS